MIVSTLNVVLFTPRRWCNERNQLVRIANIKFNVMTGINWATITYWCFYCNHKNCIMLNSIEMATESFSRFLLSWSILCKLPNFYSIIRQRQNLSCFSFFRHTSPNNVYEVNNDLDSIFKHTIQNKLGLGYRNDFDKPTNNKENRHAKWASMS